jgi:alpha-beta hydrolase superfamily lysophospholipase
MKKTVLSLLLLLVLFVAVVFVNQEQIMHPKKRALQSYHYEWLNHPEKHGMSIAKHKSKEGTPYLIVTAQELNSKRQRLLAKQLGNIKKTEQGTLVLLHGKNGRKEDLLPVVERYLVLGFTCILPDLPTHGESKVETLYYGTTSTEQHYVDEVLDDASTHFKLGKELSIWGMSLGGAFAIQTVAHSKYAFKKMVLVATFERLDRVLQEKSFALFGSFLGSMLYVSLQRSLEFFYNFNPNSANSAKLATTLSLPLYLVHGEKDELISVEQGKVLFKKFASKKKSFFLDLQGNHHNILVTKHQFFKESGLFLLGINF